jgi:hypothetical protein
MKTIALRFAENFSPECGTIAAHQDLINRFGFVWYGKLGTPISAKIRSEILSAESPKILLISSGKADRYWAFVTEIQRETPPMEYIPGYYRDMSENFKSWFKVVSFESAPKDIMAQCIVTSSKRPLTEVSKYSLSPYFIIEAHEEENKECLPTTS